MVAIQEPLRLEEKQAHIWKLQGKCSKNFIFFVT